MLPNELEEPDFSETIVTSDVNLSKSVNPKVTTPFSIFPTVELLISPGIAIFILTSNPIFSNWSIEYPSCSNSLVLKSPLTSSPLSFKVYLLPLTVKLSKISFVTSSGAVALNPTYCSPSIFSLTLFKSHLA